MRGLSPLQQEWVEEHEPDIPEDVDSINDFVEWCDHNPKPRKTGVTDRDYCPICGKVLDQSLSEYKYD